MFPVLAGLDDDYPFTDICDLLLEFAAREQMPSLSLLPAFSGRHGPDLWVSPFDQHPNETAHAIAADAILAFRKSRPSQGLMRMLQRTVITTFGRDFATAMTEFRREGGSKLGRQSQTWVRQPEGWRVVAAHVSLLDAP